MAEHEFRFPDVKDAFLQSVRDATEEIYKPREEGDRVLEVGEKIDYWNNLNTSFELARKYGIDHKEIFDAIIEAIPIGLRQEYFANTVLELYFVQRPILSVKDIEELADRHNLDLS